MLTTQVGTRSNFVGTHFWNLADENEEISDSSMNLFIVDSILEIGPTGWEKHELEISDSHFQTHKQDELELHEFQKYLAEVEMNPEISKRMEFDWSTVRFWSDFWKAREFPTHGEFLSPSRNLNFENFWEGDKIPEFAETDLRKTLENMDRVLKMQMIGNLTGGFARHTVDLAEYLHDELPKRPWLQISPMEISDASFINFARLYCEISEVATLLLDPQEKSNEISVFAQTAPLGCGLFALQGEGNLAPGLMDLNFSLKSGNQAVWCSPQFEAENARKFRSFFAPVPFPKDFVDESGEVEVEGKLQPGRPEIFRSAMKALRHFREQGGLKKTSDVELDDWIAMEEQLEEALDDRTDPDHF